MKRSLSAACSIFPRGAARAVRDLAPIRAQRSRALHASLRPRLYTHPICWAIYRRAREVIRAPSPRVAAI